MSDVTANLVETRHGCLDDIGRIYSVTKFVLGDAAGVSKFKVRRMNGTDSGQVGGGMANLSDIHNIAEVLEMDPVDLAKFMTHPFWHRVGYEVDEVDSDATA